MEKDKKVFYYSDELNDDFANTNIKTKELDENFKYIKKNILWRFTSWFLYYVFVIPILSIFVGVKFGVKIKNRKVLRKLKKTGYFVYGNHTHYIDSFVLQVKGVVPRRTNIIGSLDATSIPGVKNVVLLLGTIPIPSTNQQRKDFLEAIKYRLDQKRAIIIYPEAHIWPYYTGIRPFLNSSFYYPVKFNKPVVAAVTTFRKPRKDGKKPKFTITFSEVFYPEQNIARKIAQDNLRNEVYDFMVKGSSIENNYEYYKYVKKDQ